MDGDAHGADDLGSLTAAILAGGLGTRLRASVADRPKVLASVRGRPFLSFLLDQLTAAGLRRIVLCTGYMGDLVRAEYGETYADAELVYSREDVPLGTGGALRLALPLLGTGDVLVLNGDSYCDADLADFRRWQQERSAESALVLTRVADTSRYGRVEVEPDGMLKSFREKGGAAGAGWINAGIYLLGQDLFRSIPVGRAVSLEKDVLPGRIGAALYGYRTDGRFLDIGTPRSYTAAEKFFAGDASADHSDAFLAHPGSGGRVADDPSDPGPKGHESR